MELTINVMVDVTPTLKKLCEAFLSHTPKVTTETAQKIEANQAEPEPKEEAAPAVAEEAPKAVDDKPKEITNVMLRDAMEMVRKEFEFTDPQNPEVANAEIHKALNHQFKELARSLDADKPTALPQDKREKFLEQLSWIKVEGGEVTCLPF